MTCAAAPRWHSRAMRAALAPVVVAVVLALAGCGGAAAPEPEAIDNGPLGDYFAEGPGSSDQGSTSGPWPSTAWSDPWAGPGRVGPAGHNAAMESYFALL